MLVLHVKRIGSYVSTCKTSDYAKAARSQKSHISILKTHLYTTHASVQVCGRTRALQLVTTCACMRIAMTGTSRLFKRVHALASDHTVHTTDRR